MIDRSLPVPSELLQHTQDKRGREAYQDTDGYNVQDGYFFPDNAVIGSPKRKLRPIQPGRGYNFTRVEYIGIATPATILTEFEVEVDFSATEINTTNRYLLSWMKEGTWGFRLLFQTANKVLLLFTEYTSSNVLTLQFNDENRTDGNVHTIKILLQSGILQLLYDGRIKDSIACADVQFLANNTDPKIGSWVDGTNIFNGEIYRVNSPQIGYWSCDESTGLVAYDASGNGNHGDIELGGSAESSFHTTSNEVPSRQNEVGYSQFWIAAYIAIGSQATKEEGVSFSGRSNCTRYTGIIDNWYDRIAPSPSMQAGDSFKFMVDVYCDRAHTLQVSYDTGQENIDIPAGAWTSISTDYHGLRSTGTAFNLFHSGLLIGDEFYWDDDTFVWESELIKVPIDESGDGTVDVLGNTVPENYQGQVRYEEQIKDSSVGNFDGVLYGLIDKDFGTFTYFELELELELHTTGVNRIFFSTDDTAINLGMMFIQQTAANVLQVGNGAGSTTSSLSVPQNTKTTVTVKSNDVDKYLLFVGNESEELLSSPPTIDFRQCLVGKFNPSYTEGQKTLYSLKLWQSDSSGNRINELINLQFSETNGLVWHNIAEDRPSDSDCGVDLNGSSDGVQWSTSELQYPKNLLEGFNNGIHLINPAYGTIDSNAAFHISDFEIVMTIAPSEFDSSNNRLFFTHSDNDSTGLNTSGYEVVFNGSGRFSFLYSTGTSRGTAFIGTSFIKLNQYQKTSVKCYGTTVVLDNGQESKTDTLVNSIIAPEAGIYLWQYFDNTAYNFRGGVTKVEFYELDASGNRTKELINLDFTNIENDQVPNIGSDAPSDTDATLYGEYYKTYIPADPNNPGKDILGEDLQILGASVSKNTAENTYDRNPKDAPELAEAGIAQGEDIDYDTITEDISRFHDQYEENRLLSNLVYSDFEEPIASGGYNFTTTEYVITDALGVSSYTDFECEMYLYIDDTTNHNRGLFSINPNGLVGQGTIQVTIHDTSDEIRFRLDTTAIVTIDITSFSDAYHWYKFKITGSTWEIYVDDILRGSASQAVVGNELDLGRFILGGYYSTLYLLSGDITKCIVKADDVSIIDYTLDESSGLVAYDVSGNGNDGDIELGGSAESSFHLKDVDKWNHHNLLYGNTKVAYFKTNTYGLVAMKSEFALADNVEVELEFEYKDDGGTQRLFSVGDSNSNGWGGQIATGGSLVILIGGSGVLTHSFTSTNNGDLVKLRINSYNSNNWNLYVDDVLESSGVKVISTPTDDIYVRALYYNSTIYTQGSQSIKSYTMWGINATTGAREEELINLDFANGNESSVPNIGAEAPENSDMFWSESASYTKIPGDPSNPGKDVNGNDIDNPNEVIKYRRISKYLRR